VGSLLWIAGFFHRRLHLAIGLNNQ